MKTLGYGWESIRYKEQCLVNAYAEFSKRFMRHVNKHIYTHFSQVP